MAIYVNLNRRCKLSVPQCPGESVEFLHHRSFRSFVSKKVKRVSERASERASRWVKRAYVVICCSLRISWRQSHPPCAHTTTTYPLFLHTSRKFCPLLQGWPPPSLFLSFEVVSWKMAKTHLKKFYRQHQDQQLSSDYPQPLFWPGKALLLYSR